MIYSKAMKDNTFDESSRSIKDYIPNSILITIRNFIRGCQYFIHGLSSNDWDQHFIFHDLVFKLKRVQKALQEDPYHEPDKRTLQSMKLAIRLLERFNEDHYFFNHDLHEEKWGVGEMVFSKLDTDKPHTGSRLTVKRKNVIVGVNDKRERTEFLEAVRKDDARKQRDLDLAFKIISKYNGTWWT